MIRFRSLTSLPLILLVAGSAFAAPAARTATKAARTGSPTDPVWGPKSADFVAQGDRNLALAKQSIAKMLAVKGKRTIENTLQPYDDAVLYLDAAGNQAGLMEEVNPDSSIRANAEAMTQKLSAYTSELSLNHEVYAALSAVDLSGADDETKFYVEKELRDFRLSGVDKDEATRKKIQEMRAEIVKIGQEYDTHIREDVRTIQVANAAELEGLPADWIAAHKPGADGKITLDINYPDYVPVISYAVKEDVRKRLYMEYNNRAFPKNEATLKELITKRYELANLLGFPTWADCMTADKMAASSKNVREFIDKIVDASTASAQRDYEVLLRRKQQDVPGATVVQPWESSYFSDKVKKSQYNFDSQAIRPYLSYTNVKQGVLDVTGKMFGVRYERVTNVPVWHPLVECYDIYQADKKIGRFYLDMHPRPNKFNHAAQFGVRVGVEGRQYPEAALICNLPGGEAGDPGLCEIDDVNTFFHEFGHLLHTMFAGHHRWAGVSGIKTEHDFVEAPSQMLEEWMRDPKTLQTFAKHYQTGEPVPTELVMQMKRANEFAKGLQVRRQMVYADLSLSIYDRDPAKVDVNQIAQDLVKKYQPFPYVEGTHFPDAFGHLNGYSAGYYTYMWSLVIAKDMFSAFDKSNLLDPTIAGRYRQSVLEPGGSAPAAKLVENFLGRPFSFDSYQAWLNEAN